MFCIVYFILIEQTNKKKAIKNCLKSSRKSELKKKDISLLFFFSFFNVLEKAKKKKNYYKYIVHNLKDNIIKEVQGNA